MENPPDLIVAVTSDEQYNDKKKGLIGNIFHKQDDDLFLNRQSDKYALECQMQNLRTQRVVDNDNNEFSEQSCLLQQRFHDEIQSTVSRHNQLVQQTDNDLTTYVTNVLQKSIDDIQGLRLLHQKELCTFSNSISDSIQQQSNEMDELCHHVINQQRINPMNLFNRLIDNFQTALHDLEVSFQSKINYLTDIHTSTISKLNTKHDMEINEMKCELNLLSNRRN